MIRVEVSNRQTSLDVNTSVLRRVVQDVLRSEGVEIADVSVAIVSDQEIHELNCRYLDHDYPTDVLSFVLDRNESNLEGEVIVSTETAIARCGEFGWSAAEELTLYAIHGTLHLVGYLDKTPEDVAQMRERETFHLRQHGMKRPASTPPHSCSQGDVEK